LDTNLSETSTWLQLTTELIGYKDEKGKYTWANKALAHFLGLKSPADIQGKSDFDFFSRDLAQQLWESDKKILREELTQSNHTQVFHLPAQPIQWFSLSRYPLKSPSGSVVGLVVMASNISEVKNQNYLLDYLAQNIQDSIFFKDTEGKYIWANTALLSKFGLTRFEELQGKTEANFVTPDKFHSLHEEEQSIIKTGQALIGQESSETHSDGERHWMLNSKIPLRNSGGVVSGICGFSRDITRIKLAEERLDILMDNIPDPIYFKDEKSRFTLINKACAQGFGLSDPAEAYGKTDFDFFSIEHAQPSFDDEQTVIKTGTPIIGKEELEVWPNGRYTWALSTKLPLRDHQGRIVGTFGLTRDITKIKQAEEQLQSLMDNIPDSIYFKDVKSRFIRINKAFSKKLGLQNPEDIKGKTDFDFFAREHAQAAFDDERKVMEGLEVIGKEEFVRWPQAQASWVSCTKLPLRDPKGSLIGTFGLSHDISGLKKVEEELHKAKDNLEAQVLQRTLELREANQGMEIRIRQLNYLNQKAHYLASLMDKDLLHKAIFEIFTERFPMGQVHLVDLSKKSFISIATTAVLKKPAVLETCLAALDFMETNESRSTYFENRWMENPLLENIFHSDLREYPCYLEIPLLTDRRLRGVIQIFAPREFDEKFKQESPLLNTLASQIAVALDNAIHYAEIGEQTRIQSELEIAQKIQKRYIPQAPSIQGFKLKGICQPANEVGGDYLDFFQNERGDWVIVIADVCGKGIPAALVMTSLRSFFRTEARGQVSSKALMCAVNKYMAKDLQLDNSFITALCLILDREGNSFNFARAGHPMLIAQSPHGAKPTPIKSDGIALGMLVDETFDKIIQEVNVELKPGDRFIAYTDGLTEGMNKNREAYGIQRLNTFLESHIQTEIPELIPALVQDLTAFSSGEKFYDDLTLFAFEKLN